MIDEMLDDMMAAWALTDHDGRIRLYVDACRRMGELQQQVTALNEQAACGDRQLIELRQRVTVLEAWVIRAQDAFRRALLLQIRSAELRELRDSAPIAKPEPEPPAHSGVRVYNYANDKPE